MRTDGCVYRFGPFELDSSRRVLNRGAQTVFLPDRHLDVLLLLVSNAGQVVSKQNLIEGAWDAVAVTDNSIVQAVTGLRKALGTQENGAPYIETAVRRGYRFRASVEREQPRQLHVAFDAVLHPHRAFIDGRAALETLDRGAVARAREAFEEALRVAPNLAAAHIGVANARVLEFEAARVNGGPDSSTMEDGARHAREACRLDPSSGEAWSTLAFVLHAQGNSRDAVAAARTAIGLEPDDWRHYLSLAFVGWGEERLRAAHRLSRLCPGLALAHWFAATVFIARQAFDAALTALRAGCAAQDAQRKETGRFHIVGVHLLHGQVLAARGCLDEAVHELEREIALEDNGHIYAPECYGNVWYSIGAIRLRQGRTGEAEAAFREARNRVPSHALAGVGLAAVSPVSNVVTAPAGTGVVDAAIISAARLALAGNHDEAARACGDVLARADPGSAGWVLAVDPLLQPTAHLDSWAATLAMLRDRAA